MSTTYRLQHDCTPEEVRSFYLNHLPYYRSLPEETLLPSGWRAGEYYDIMLNRLRLWHEGRDTLDLYVEDKRHIEFEAAEIVCKHTLKNMSCEGARSTKEDADCMGEEEDESYESENLPKKNEKRSRLSQSEFVCRKCGFELNADHNAAINILARGLALV